MKANRPEISVIIPVLNESGYIGALLRHLRRISGHCEILVVDGGSTDGTREEALAEGAIVLQAPPGRARQMNYGARVAKGQLLYFLHADTFPPDTYANLILEAVNKGHMSGCFRMKFDSDRFFLRFFSWFTRINHPYCRGGDQSLFVDREVFMALDGFNEEYSIYEDNELTGRLYRHTSFKVINACVRTSARLYYRKNMYALQYHFGVMHLKNILGAGPETLARYYRKNIAC